MAVVPRILIVSPQSTTSPLWRFSAFHQQPALFFESNPAGALKRWAGLLPDIIVLDMEEEDLALQVIRVLREEATLPILLLTFLQQEKFHLESYWAGVDECILKPITPALFHAKIKAWLRRSWNVPVNMLDPLRVGLFHLLPSDRVLKVDGNAVHVTNLELRLLYALMGRASAPVTTDELCHRVWGEQSSEGSVVALKSLVYRLRQKIEADPAQPRYLLTVPGVGYQFVFR